MLRRLTALHLAAAALLLAAASPAFARGVSHRITPFTSMAGVRFGWTPAHVRRSLGRPVSSARAGDEPGEYIYSSGGDENVSIFFEPNSPHDGAWSMSVVGSFSTIKGIHASTAGGSSIAAVRRVFGRYPHFHCHRSLYCVTTRGAADEADAYGATELQFDFLDDRLIGFDMERNLIR